MCNPSQGFYGSNNTFSPATQAVWDAAYNTPEDCPYEHDLAAALEAAADQADPKRHIEDISYQYQMYVDGWKDCLEVIRDIAAELRGEDQPSSEEL